MSARFKIQTARFSFALINIANLLFICQSNRDGKLYAAPHFRIEYY